MSDIATCAVCGEKKELCNSCRIDGITQPRLCKECLINTVRLNEDPKINDGFWLTQMVELKDTESISLLSQMPSGGN